MAAIKAKDKIRGKIAECSGYYDFKYLGINAVDTILAANGYCLVSSDYPGDEGHRLTAFHPIENNDFVGFVSFSWYRMPSGRYEFTVYIT